MLAEIACEDYVHCLNDIVEELLAAAHVAAPPVDAFALARRLGILVAVDDRQTGRARCARLNSARPLILVRSEERPERGQWSVAHEIGEHVCQRVFARLGVDPHEAPPGTRERVANLLAARLLLPSAWFLECAVACEWDLFAMKQSFATASHELIARRMLDFEPPVAISIFDHGRFTFRRANFGVAPPLSALEVECRRRAASTGQPASGESPEETVAAWPIHEPGWPREIVRAEKVTGRLVDW